MNDYYGQIDYDQIQGIDGVHPISETGSFLVAKCNLLKKFGNTINPAELNDFFADKGTFVKLNDNIRDDLYWDAITEFDPSISITGMDTGWPSTNNAIVKFHCQSIQVPHVIEDGVPVPNMISHFCVVADYEKKLVIDSYDGQIKEAGPYGTPVSHAVYVQTTSKPPQKTKLVDEDRYYTVVRGGESITAIASKLKIPRVELVEHNQDDIADPSLIPEGTKLHLPYPKPQVDTRVTSIEVLPELLEMHISKEGGTHKYSFGNAKTWDDIAETGHLYKQNTNVTILAIARVPLTDHDQQVMAKYYMGRLELGNYLSTGRVAWEIGFNHSHLSEGHVEQVKPKPRPEVSEAVKQAKLAKKVAQEVEQLDAEINPYPNQWKETYKPYLDGPKVFLLKEDIIVDDLDDRRDSRLCLKNMRVLIAGDLVKKEIWYGRPLGTVKNIKQDPNWQPNWLSIPMDLLILESELHDPRIDLPTRVAMHGRLSTVERYVAQPLARTLNSLWFKQQVDKVKVKIKE